MLHGSAPVERRARRAATKSLASPRPQKPERLELHQQDGGEGVVDHRDVDVVAAKAGPVEKPPAERDRAVHHRQVGAVVVGGDLLLEQAGS